MEVSDIPPIHSPLLQTPTLTPKFNFDRNGNPNIALTMDLIGTKIRKNFQCFGVFTGVVQSYDAAAGYYKIQYEDGDSEDLELEEIESILKEMSGSSPNFDPNTERRGRGRPPKKRRLLNSNLEFDGTPGSGKETPLRRGRKANASENGELNSAVRSPSSSVLENGCSKNEFDETLVSEKATPLRRSDRRALRATKCENMSISEDDELGGGEKEGLRMPELPPSSDDSKFDGLNVFDLFSVYTCLRSFSRILFLSPFRLDTFVTALKCDHANFLIDSIHFSLLQSLKQRLESLSEEGSPSASYCLRYLNWELLDLVTWPVFLVHYLLAHVPVMSSGSRLSQLKFLDLEFHKQPAGVKLEILRYLCDDVIEIDAIRLELNRRMGSEINADASCVGLKVEKKRRSSSNMEPDRHTAEQGCEEIDDGNIDECCLCGMDGSLICCDGCPAAFHSRCVGVVKDLLPEGEWYCPECSVEKSDRSIDLSKPSSGAEFLGIDPHGRLYFGSCDHLLVSDSCESDASYHYYNKNDMDAVIMSLKSCYAYSEIVNAISMYRGFPVDASASASNSQYCNEIHYLKENLEVQVQPTFLLTSKDNVIGDGNAERLAVENASCVQCELKSFQVSDLVHLNSVTSLKLGGMNSPISCSEPFAENGPISTLDQASQQASTECPMECFDPSKQVVSLNYTDLTPASDKLMDSPGEGCVTNREKAGALDLPTNPNNYINYYCFGRIASSIYVELMRISSEGNTNESKKSIEDIKSAQLQAIYSKSNEGCCYAYQVFFIDAQKENCGWCFCCRTSSDSDCLFKVARDKSVKGSKHKELESSRRPTIRPHSENSKKSHITSAMHHILSTEARARSLLSGPWLKPHYSQLWREAVMKASDVTSLKPLLLTLELNLRRIALSAEWSKPVDDAHAIISASIVTSPVRESSNHGSRREQGKKTIPGVDPNITSHHAKIMDIYWWRGGQLSRQAFQCKMLPRALAFKGGRQAGCKKIPHILYPESLEFAKRSKYMSWRVAVEMSETVAQLTYQVKDFDSNIKWSELFNTCPFPKMAKESKKMARLMKKVTISGKRKEGTQVKYLLDFGKRETVPSVVTKHGVLFEEATDDRKKYWLSEAHVPLNILKAYEEKNIRKKITRLLKKTDSPTVNEGKHKTKERTGKHTLEQSEFKTKKRKRSEGLAYLISREQNSEKQLCGHCNEYILVREAVKCQICDGSFHRKHFRVPKGSITTTYTCSKCRYTRNMNVNEKDTKCVKGNYKDMKGMNLMPRATNSVNKKANDIESIKAKENDLKNWNLRDREVRRVNWMDREASSASQKAKGSQNVKAKEKVVKGWNLGERSIKSMNVKYKGTRSERVHRKDITGLTVKIQMHKTASTRRKLSENKKVETVPEKKIYFLRKNKKKYTSHKRSKKGKSKRGKSQKCESGITWHKRKRSLMHHSYWLNGLLWARKPVTEQQRYFQERNVILPFQHAEDAIMRHLCRLCDKEYNFGALYICCERCQGWFHGDAFCVTVENVDNLIGFRCHKCRMRSEPVCPFLIAGMDADCEIGADIACNNCKNDEGKHCDHSKVCNEDCLDGGLREDACVEHQIGKGKATTGRGEKCLDERHCENDTEEKRGLCPKPLLTNGYIGGLQHMNNLEKSQGGGCDDRLNTVQARDHMDEEPSRDTLLEEEKRSISQSA